MLPIIDLHCDLLSYLVNVPNANALNKRDIGCALPYLKEGKVKLQAMAVFTQTKKGSHLNALKQFDAFETLCTQHADDVFTSKTQQIKFNKDKTAAILAIENASGLLEENEPLELLFERLDTVLRRFGNLLYITFTHHTENRFGGGNYSEVGLKQDGVELLRYMHGKGIAVDLSHTSDQMAFDLLATIDKLQLKIPVLASHSNMRAVWEHPRNLPDELIEELIARKGIAGVNFVRAFLHETDPEVLYKHISYGFYKKLPLVFGADFFSTAMLNDPARIPYFFESFSNAGQYPVILKKLQQNGLDVDACGQIAHENAMDWLQRVGYTLLGAS